MKKPAAILLLSGIISGAVFAAPLASNDAYVLKNGLDSWTNTGDHLWHQGYLTIGDKVALLGETRSFVRDGETDDYVMVRASGKSDAWVKVKFLSSGSSLAVVKADRAMLYDGPEEAKKTARFVFSMAVVTIMPEKTPAGFARIQGYDRILKTFIADPSYVRMEDLATAETDLRAAILYTTAIDTPQKRGSILADAMKQCAQTVFMQALQTAAGGASAVGRAVEPADGTFAVNDDNVNVRSAPDEKRGFVIDRLGKGMRVHVKERTKLAYTVTGNTAAWFHTTHPDGWIFGFYLEDTQSIWTLAPGIRPDWRIIISLTRVDMHMLAEYGFRTNPDTGWLTLMGCFPVSDLSGPWIAMEAALNGHDVYDAMRKAEEIAMFAARAGLTAGAADIAAVIKGYAEKTGDTDMAARMNDFSASLRGCISNSVEFNREMPDAFLALKPGTLFVGGEEDVRALGFPEVMVRVANMLDLLLKDMNDGPGLAVCAQHPDKPKNHKIEAFKKLIRDLRIDIEGVAGFMNEEDLEPAVWIASYMNGAWGSACSMAKGFCGDIIYATNYKED